MLADSEFRKDQVSGDWVLVAKGRKKKPVFFSDKDKITSNKEKEKEDISKCPFEDPQKSGNPFPLLWYPSPEAASSEMEDLNSWFVQVIVNKYPLLSHEKKCPVPQKKGLEEKLDSVGYHEVIITRDHNKTIADMSVEEVQLVLKAYKERYRVLAKDPCVKYILIFHNQGELAGASVPHPHSQLVALPIIDPDVAGSLRGSADFFKENKKCVHCAMVDDEIKDGSRVISKNKYFTTLVPFAPRVPYEIRIYPIEHSSRFEDLDKEEFPYLAEALRDSAKRINKALNHPDYNFFIHTAPVGDGHDHYHWHIEILPRGFKWAGLELGGGVEVIVIPPEDAAKHLRKVM